MTLEIIIAEKLFHDFLASHDHPLDDAINHDSSKFHYYKCPHGSATDARYKFHSDGIPSGYFKCWKCQIEVDFCSKQKHEVSSHEWQNHIERMAECKRQTEHEVQQKHSEAAILAKAVFGVASEESVSDHDYLRLKQVKNYGLRVLTIEDEATKKAKCFKGTLLVPLFNINNELVNLERIYFSKKENKFQKRPLNGGQRNGAFYLLGDVIDSQGMIYICEGYSTTATVYEATKCPSVVSFNCGNIPHVTKILRQKYPQARLIIIADDDKWHDNPKLKHAGLKAAEKACKNVKNCTYLLPDFGVLELSKEKLAELKPTDINDLFVLLLAKGLDRTAALDIVRQQIQKNSTQGDSMTENNNAQSKEAKPKQSEALLQLIDQGGYQFFHDDHQDAFCKYPSQKSKVYEVRRIADKKFKNYLAYIYRQSTGKTIGDQGLKEVLSELEGRALYDKNSKKEKVFLRVGELNGIIYIDLCNDKWQAIEISSTGWKVLDSKDVPVRFERSQHSLSLPDPNSASTGDISKLWEIVNIPKDDQILVLPYILECYRYGTAFLILVLLGLQDSGKSATQNTLRNFIDPSSSNLRTPPRKADDLVTEAGSNWLVSYNNVSYLSADMHDDFCCMATGSGFATRTYFTNTQQTLVNITRPIIVNGICNFIRKPDLLDRSIILELDSIDESKRKTDAELSKLLKENLPIIFRGLLDLMVKVLEILPSVTLDKMPRMADFALLGIATEKALNLPEGTFIKRYRDNRANAKESILDSSPVMLALADFIEKQDNKFWRGRPSELLEELTKFKEPSIHTTWPKTPQAMGGELKRYTAPLYGVGIEVINETKSNGKKNRTGNIYRISKTSANKTDDAKTSPQCPPSPHNDEKTKNHGASEGVDSVDLGVDIAAKSTTKSTRSPHLENPANPRDTYVPEGGVDLVDIVDFKTQLEISKTTNDDSILI